jgi:putative serine protease PepD
VVALLVGAGAGYAGSAIYDNRNDGDPTTGIFRDSPRSSSSAAPAPAGSAQQVAADVLPSVVKIEVAGSDQSGSGSGIIIAASGEIVTNNHVVEIAGDDGQIRVDFNDGTSAPAKILGTDPLTDTAVIKVDKEGIKPATIGSSDSLVVGQGVVAIGSPFGLDSTVTAGIVSALDRPVNVGSDGEGNQTVYPAIQTDAAINPGNSGGALVNLAGEVVGINASIRTDGATESGSIGLGFAIPFDEVKPIIEQMIKGETPTHARLGITVSDVHATTSTPGEGESTSPFGGDGSTPSPNSQEVSPFSSPGALITGVNKGSTAEKAGLKKGDIILKVDDTLIFGADSLVATIRSYRPGDEVTITYTRDGKEDSVKLVLDSDAEVSTS